MRCDALAKLTMSLRVTGVRADGYHKLDAVMVTVSEPHDIVSVEPAATMSLVVEGPFAGGVPLDETNLAWRAAVSAGATCALRIEKNIPAGAGLGGSSADAAAVLLALDALWSPSAGLGSRVRFCIQR